MSQLNPPTHNAGPPVDADPSTPADLSAGQIRVLLVDDEVLMRAGLRLILDGAENITVVGEAGNGIEAVQQAQALHPDVVLMDIRMPGADGIEGCRGVRALEQAPQVVMLTAFDTDAFILEALESGAVGFMLKDTPPRQLVQAVQDAATGSASVSPSVLSRLIAVATAHGRRPGVEGSTAGQPGAVAAESPLAALSTSETTTPHAPAGPNVLDVLSDREREIADAVARGLTNTEIAEEMFLSITTVKTHVARIFTKLNVTNRVQVAILVLEQGSR